MRYASQDRDGALFWAERGVGFVVIGSGDRDRLTQIAKLVYDQSDKLSNG
jgi:anti-sigma factor RsiW